MRTWLIPFVVWCVVFSCPVFGQQSTADITLTPFPSTERCFRAEATRLSEDWTTLSRLDRIPEIDAKAKPWATTPSGDRVLIIQDTLPWGVNVIQTTLAANGIPYDEVDRSQIGVIDLAPYKLVVVPSVQGEPFVLAWNANITWAEEYLDNGGRFWISALTTVGTNFVLPGGVTSSYDSDDQNHITKPDHRWVQGVPGVMGGSDASGVSFSNLPSSLQSVAVAWDSRKPVLVDLRYGKGRALLTGQALELATHFGWDGAPILENSLLNLYADVLILQDSMPWGVNSIQQVLESYGIAYETMGSAQISVADYWTYNMVLVPGVQGDTFVGAWNADVSRIEQAVAYGGLRLWLAATTMGGTDLLVPGGVIGTSEMDDYNDIVIPSHFWVRSVPTPMYGDSASHNTFSNLYRGSKVVATAQDSGNPALVDFTYGCGRVFLTGETLELAWSNSWDGGPIVEDSIHEMFYDMIFNDGFETGVLGMCWADDVQLK